jgi:PAS domain S-box-containing protein
MKEIDSNIEVLKQEIQNLKGANANLEIENRALKLSLESLKKSDEVHSRLIATLNKTSDFVSIFESTGEILYLNYAAHKLLEVSEDADLSSLTISDCHPPWASKIIREEGIPGAIREGQWEGETAIRSHDGRHVPVSQIIIAHSAVDGHPRYFSTIARNISDQKQTEKALEQSKEELESQVEQYNDDLTAMIEALQLEIAEHEEAEKALRKSEEALRKISRNMVATMENERKMIAQELHDSIGADLAAIKFGLEEKLASMDSDLKTDVISLEKIISMIKRTLKDTKRLSASLRPSILDDLGLLAAIRWFCKELREIYSNIQIVERIEVEESEVPDPLKIVIYRIIQEAVNNAARHSDADRVELKLAIITDRLSLEVRDNGCGFDVQAALSLKSANSRMGLEGMRERVELSDGNFSLSSDKGHGTTVSADWSLDRSIYLD